MYQVVDRLAEQGLLTLDTGPGAHLVRLNRDHLAAEPSIALASLRARALDRIREEVAGWTQPALHVSMFGSAARGDGSSSSDIDLLVAHRPFRSLSEQEEWDDQLARSSESIHQWTGNWAGWFQATDEEIGRMAVDGNPIVAEWRRDGVKIFGPSLDTLLREAS